MICCVGYIIPGHGIDSAFFYFINIDLPGQAPADMRPYHAHCQQGTDDYFDHVGSGTDGVIRDDIPGDEQPQ